MAKVLTAEELRNAIDNQKYFTDGKKECAEGIKYDFRLGTRFLKAYFGRPMDYSELVSAEDKKKAVVDPGEVVFVLSRERIKLPKNVYIQLNPKRSLSQDGIELLGGFTVDPGYEGFLVFGLRNVAGKPYVLRPDTKIVGALFFELSDGEVLDETVAPNTIDDFPQRLQELIEKYVPVNPQNLAEDLRLLKASFEDKQSQLSSDVAELRAQVEAFSRQLVEESTRRDIEIRQQNENLKTVSNKLDNLSKDNVKHETVLDNIQRTLNKIEEQTMLLKDGASVRSGEGKVRSNIVTAIVTFVITVIAGLAVYFLTQ